MNSKVSFESQGSTSEDVSVSESSVRTASLDLASLRTLEEIKEAFSELTKEEVRHFIICHISLWSSANYVTLKGRDATKFVATSDYLIQ